MTIDQLHQYLQSDLRYVLENPTESAKAELMTTIEGCLSTKAKHQSADSSLWWMNQLINSVRSFSRFPTKEEFNRINRMPRQYHELVTSGIIEPVGVTRKKQFDSLTDWFNQELEDRAYAFLSRPTDDTKRVLEDQLGRFCQLRSVSLM
jgi:hypothetical protein